MVAAKAWIALVGLIVTALLGSSVVPLTGTSHLVLTIVAVVVTAFSTWRVPNANPPA